MAGVKRQHPFPIEPKAPRPTFDIFMVEDSFSKVKPVPESETQLLNAILKRNTDLTPTLEEQTNIAALVSQVQNVLEVMSLDPQYASVFDEVRIVGSYKKGTMVRGKNEADIVLVLRQNPTLESVTQISDRMQSELSNTSWSSSFSVTGTDYGFCVSNTSVNASVRILITTQVGNMRKTAEGQQQHIAVNLQQKHLSAIRHVRWFEGENRMTLFFKFSDHYHFFF
jgi:interleukin enhancer-binding factor 2